MGVEPAGAVATAPTGWTSRLLGWSASPLALRRLAVASVVVNVGIVVTGGAVRLTNSGLGCPTWPNCTGSDLVPTNRLGIHSAIEFTNRTLTFVVGLTLLLTLIAAWRQHRERGLALLAFLGVPAQAVLGGIVVLTDLNPWLVAAHFLLSAAIIALTMALWWRVSDRSAVVVPAAATLLGRGLTGLAALVLAAGTVVTGTGPHAGDLDVDGRLHRIRLSTAGVAQFHADLVMLLIGASVGMLAATYALRLPLAVRRAAAVLVAVELAQGVIGYIQYFLHVPPLLVLLHMFGACLVWIAVLRVWLLVDPLATSSRAYSGTARSAAAGVTAPG